MNNSKKDINLKEAVRRHEQKLPPMPADLNERVMKRAPLLTSPKGEERKRRRLWLWIGAVAASIVLLIAFNYNNKVMPEEQPLVAEVVEQPAPEAPKVSENSEVSDNSKSSEPIKPKRTNKNRKVSKPVEEPLLAQVDEEPIIPADKQALVDIYLAEEALQVAYELQAQQAELRAYAASLTGVEEPQPQPIIAF
jgi:hypothetical protein